MKKIILSLVLITITLLSGCSYKPTHAINASNVSLPSYNSFVSTSSVEEIYYEEESSSVPSYAEYSSTAKTNTSSSKSASTNSSRTVYRTPSGKRYHYISTCGGKNSYAISFSSIGNLTACQKCVH